MSLSGNLVIVRAGKESLHGGWLELPAGKRGWDLIVSYYHPDACAAHPEREGVTKHYYPGGKWSGIYDAVTRLGVLERYEYIWCPDDDILIAGGEINRLFETAGKWKLALCQPALLPAGFYFHFLVTRCPAFELRFTNFVEVMAPCFSRARLGMLLPLFKDRHTGVGLDYIWAAPGLTAPNSAAILDAVSMTHTRPVGSALGKAAGKLGQPQGRMRRRLLRDFGFERPPPQVVLAAVAAGQCLTDADAIYRLMYSSYAEQAVNYQDPALAAAQNEEMFKSYSGQIAALADFAVTPDKFRHGIARAKIAGAWSILSLLKGCFTGFDSGLAKHDADSGSIARGGE